MQSPAAKDIRARWIRKRIRSGGEEDDRIEIENIEAVKSITDQEIVDSSEDSSDSTVTEDKKESSRSGCDLIQVQEETELSALRIDVGEVSSSDDSSPSTSSSSTGGSDKSDISSSSSSSDSTRSVYFDSEDLDVTTTTSSMNKSPICDGKRDGLKSVTPSGRCLDRTRGSMNTSQWIRTRIFHLRGIRILNRSRKMKGRHLRRIRKLLLHSVLRLLLHTL